jgi:hypothetical protein
MGIGEPGIMIGSFRTNGTKLIIGISPASYGPRSTGCMLIESSIALSSETIDQLYTLSFSVGTTTTDSYAVHMYALTESTNPKWDQDVVSWHGVKGMDLYEFDLSKIAFNDSKHYYALAMWNKSASDCECIDKYIAKFKQ